MSGLILTKPEIASDVIQPRQIGVSQDVRMQLADAGLFADTPDFAIDGGIADSLPSAIHEQGLVMHGTLAVQPYKATETRLQAFRDSDKPLDIALAAANPEAVFAVGPGQIADVQVNQFLTSYAGLDENLDNQLVYDRPL